jgi:hypothetical protein
MSDYHSRIAHRFAHHPGGGNCANAAFFERMALAFARAALRNLDRAHALDADASNGDVRHWLESTVETLEAKNFGRVA